MQGDGNPIGLLNFSLDTPGALPVLMYGPHWQDAVVNAFAAAEAWPSMPRQREHGPEHDGWQQVSTGHWQLILVTCYLPEG